MDDLLERVLRPPQALTFPDAAAWWADHRASTGHLARPIDRAILGATRVDRLGFAFAGGYAAALRAMVPDLPDALASFAATEAGGVHPRAIRTTLVRDGDGWRLDGQKSWVTLGPEGGTLLVVAREATTDDRPVLRVVRVDASAPGVTVTSLPHLPMVPEIPHASLTLDGVRVPEADVLPGDGYDRYLKPFRTIEDLHVHAAVLAWLLAIAAREGWPRPVRERALAALIACRALSSLDPSAPATHVALGGLIAQARAVVADFEPCWADPEMRARWERDRPLLDVAGKARSRRIERAWERITSG